MKTALRVALCPSCEKRLAPRGSEGLTHELPPLLCRPCILETRRQVEAFANVWAPILIASFALTGRWPDVDPSLLVPEEGSA